MLVAFVALHADPAHFKLAGSTDNLITATIFLDHDATLWARPGSHDHDEIVANSLVRR